MELTQREKTLKYGIYCLVLAVAALLQNTDGLFPAISGAGCFLLLPTTVLLGLGEEEKHAALLGLFGGLLWDAFSEQPIEINGIFLMLVTYLTAALVVFVFRNTYWFGIVASAVVIGLYIILHWLLFVVIKGGEGAGRILLSFYIPSAFYTIAVSLPLYALLMPLKNKLNHVQ